MGDDYFSFTEVYAAFEWLQTQHPQHVQLLALPELTHEGRSVRALRLCENTSSSVRKPVFMVIGGLHGCEWGSSEIIINLATTLLQGRDSGLDYGGGVTHTKAVAQSILQGLDLLLVPLANPDGGFTSRTNFDSWRKNRSREQASSGPGIGVDLNRNFDHPLTGSTEPVTSSQYAGPAPFSEPESRNIRALVQAWDPDWFVDLHSAARCVVFPWSVEQPAASMPAADVTAHEALGSAYAGAAQQVSGQPIRVSAGFQFTSATGTSHDWVYARARPPHPAPGGGSGAPRGQTLAFCIEWSRDTVPMWFDMQAQMRESGAGLVAMCLRVLSGQPRP